MKAYVADFRKQVSASDEAKKLRDSMQSWLEVFKFPSVERTTYDRAECTAKNQIYPLLGDMIVSEITAKEIRRFLNKLMNHGYAYTTFKNSVYTSRRILPVHVAAGNMPGDMDTSTLQQ